MSRLEKYPKYKDSGVEWLGEIPSEWETLSNKHIFKIKQNLVGKKAKNYDLLSLTLNGIIKRDMDNPKGKFPAEFDTYQEVKKDDFIFCLFDVEETPRTVGLSKYDGMITGAYTVMEINENMNKDYLYYFYLNLDASKRMKPLYKGLRNTIPKDSFFSFKTFIPPLQEQQKIASFLDTKTQQLDKAIKQKEQLIKLLKERKQIVINEAVTKGLDKTVAMKDSGVEWLGEIPEHWKIGKLKYITNKIIDGTHFTPKYQDEGIPFLRVTDLHNKEIDLSKVAYISKKEHIELIKRCNPQIGDLLLSKNGTIGLTKIVTWNFEFSIFVSLCLIKLKNNVIIPEFLEYEINSQIFTQQLAESGKITSITNLHLEMIREMLSLLPPKQEQKQIVNFIENQTSKIDNAINLQQKQIDKLKEYKTSLIDSIVTGKVRVCDE